MLLALKANPNVSIEARKREKGRRTNLLRRGNKRDLIVIKSKINQLIKSNAHLFKFC